MKLEKLMLTLLTITAVLLCMKQVVFTQETIPLNPQVQDNKPFKFFVGLSYTNSIPLHDYSKELMNSPQGFNINAGIKPRDFPFSFGLNIEYLNLKDKFYRYTYEPGTYTDGWTSGISFPLSGYVGYYTFPNPDDIYHIMNTIVPVSIFARFQPINENYFQPYAEFSVGFNSLYLLGIPNYNFDNSSVVNLRFYSYFLTYFYGISLGATINPNEIIASSNIFSNMRLNINCRYTKGFQYNYMNYLLNEYQSSERYINIDAQRQIDFIFYSLGLQYQF